MSSSKRRRQTQAKTTRPSASGPATTLGSSPRSPRSKRRLWLFRLASVVLAPVSLLAMLEVGLRLGGCGYPTSLYIGSGRAGVRMTNPRFGWRFFSPALARIPEPNLLSAKPPGTVRIFVLGGSAALGVPNPGFGFGRILEVMLRERHPGVRFEVVNAAMTAINSYVVLEIARDCSALRPDLFVVYMGNNEVVGPYGPGAVFQDWCPDLYLIRAILRVKSTRAGQLLASTVRSFRPDGSPKGWRGMRMAMDNPVAAEDPRLASTYDNFRRNLLDICRVARRAKAAVVLSTVAVNLRGCPPFASRHRAGLSKGEGDRWQSLYRAGIDLQDSTRWAEALAQYEKAARIDDRFAELQFRMGESLAALGRAEEARQRLLTACDLDVLRFRADQRINQAIRDVFVEREADGVVLTDAEGALARAAPETGGLPGNDVFFEHVHLNFEGNYLLARALLAQVERALPHLRASSETSSVPSRQRCARALAMTAWDEYQSFRQMADMTSRPPFSGQLAHAARMAALREKTTGLARLASEPESAREARRLYEAALESAPDDWSLHHRYGKLLLAAGETQQAVEQMRIALGAYPWNLPLHIDLGIAESMNGRNEEAVALFEEALKIYPEHLMAHSNLVTALAREGRIHEATEHLQRAIEIDPEHDDAHINLGVALDERGDTRGAIAQFRKALEVNPTNPMAHYDLGIALARQGRVDEAIGSLRRALDNNPNLEAAHINLGIALAGRGNVQEAMAHFRTALEIRPGDPAAYYNLGSGWASLGRIDEAIASFRKAVEADPDHYDAQIRLGIALARKDPDEAVAHFREAQRIRPGNPTACYDLGIALAALGRIDDAAAELRKALEIRPDFADARRELQSLSRAGRRGAGSATRREAPSSVASGT